MGRGVTSAVGVKCEAGSKLSNELKGQTLAGDHPKSTRRSAAYRACPRRVAGRTMASPETEHLLMQPDHLPVRSLRDGLPSHRQVTRPTTRMICAR